LSKTKYIAPPKMNEFSTRITLKKGKKISKKYKKNIKKREKKDKKKIKKV